MVAATSPPVPERESAPDRVRYERLPEEIWEAHRRVASALEG